MLSENDQKSNQIPESATTIHSRPYPLCRVDGYDN